MFTDFDALPIALSVQQAAEVLHISRNTAYELVRCGKLHSIKVGKQYRIPKASLWEYMVA